ncbi:hypothetical protein POPTR_001G472400v4 [Populus trichocarpa]|uniref:Uncharacterized protein n=3 Tax=Populus trichocarpa TaxID=3694 RepID=A0ACC0TPW8_POPTR|nr:uncharacterized protein LOC7471715 [Populus trichocarpa]XP_052311338.1 uncharacterized protein LOC7471715 [Populus trichocarpa]KAI5606233.1 hypothetical protein BDE02_01G406700 [Populus trichocarpa]KAI5606235.1 hypothetical protein BDE02_01G406700 [Populus trichocarpa]KAI9403677.1 hypothetical protein POPTR_001G472400v4 [Populus trichocarpa]KAI9403678.1 hypothetical protein POPTR_001G472400v4 [Populus trichocarpa]
MLSIENPPVPDPSCSSSQLNSSDERAYQLPTSTNNKLPSPNLSEVVVVNLPNTNPSLHHHHHTPLPNFSIRDYVFKARSKDIKNSWPFSQNNLQLCLKHGVKDVLPKFQPHDTVRNQFFKRCTGETSSVEKENNFDKEASRPDNRVLLDSSDDAQLNNKLAESCVDISSCRSGEENDFPSTTTSEINSVPDNRQRRSPLETQSLAKAAVEVEAPVTHKTESTSRPLAKKCRLIVKFGGSSDRSSAEDIASNCTTTSETMASKVCPVCKTFSSSSNTTLNAHIDQCLSVESTPKWTSDSKPTRYRIKPRKNRLMVDIYATAQYCTLEDLDRRNGTSWATMSSLPAQETEKSDAPNEGKKQRVSPIHPEDAADVGPVYIDADGTKVRILSQFNDTPPVEKVSEDIGARREDIGAKKSLKGGKASKYISKKKKKRLAQKHQKYLRLASQSKKIFFHKAPCAQISGGQEEFNGEGKSCEKEQRMLKQINPNDGGTLRPWICSKRRGFPKKIPTQEDHQPVRCKWHLAQDLLVENDSLSERSRTQKSVILSDNPISSHRNIERTEKPFHKDQVNESMEHSPGRKMVTNLPVRDRINGKVDKLFPPMKLSKDGTSIRDTCLLRPPDSPRIKVSSLTKKTIYTDADTSNNSDTSPIASTKSSRSSRTVVSKALRFCSFRKSVLSVSSQSSVTESRPSEVRKWSTLDKSEDPSTTEIDEDAMGRHSEVDEQYDLMQDHTENVLEREEITDEVSLGGSSIRETRQEKRLSCSSERLEVLSLRSSKSTPRYGHDEEINVDSSARFDDDDYLRKIDPLESPGTQVRIHEDIVVEPSSKTLDGRTSTSGTSKSVDTGFYELGVSSKVPSKCLRSIEHYEGLSRQNDGSTGPTEPGFVHDQGMFSAAEAGNGMMGHNADMRVVELDSEAAKVDSFPEVDPILIPGPPGSFLPSPRDMGSEDFQGNSSLTSSQVQSSPDQYDVIDGDSSDSPLSAASTISNSMAGRPDFNYSEPPSSAGHYVFQDNMRSGLISAGIEPLAQNADAVPQAATTRVERATFLGEHVKLDGIPIEKESFGLKNDQPCCCQRKERFAESVALNHQESQLLRRRKTPSMTFPSVSKQMGCNSNPMPINLDVRPELVSLNSYSASGSEKMVLPLIKPPGDPIPLKDSPNNSAVRSLARADGDSASPSASNPILRLMGKNLMVVNKDDHVAMPIGQVQPCAQTINRTPHFPTISAVSPGNIQNQDSHSFHRVTPQGFAIFSRDPYYKTAVQRFDVGLSNSFGSHTDSKLPRAPSQLPAGMFCDQQNDGGFVTSMKPQQCKDDYNFSSSQNRLKRRLDAFPTCTMQKATETPDRQCKRADSSAHPVKEIIIIDDVPESQTVVISDITRYNEGWRERQAVPSGISVPTIPVYNMSNVNPFTCYQSQDHPPLGGTPLLHNGNFHATATRLVNTSPVRWGCPSEGPSVLQQNPFVAASNSSGHPRSASLYYSPSFS